MKLIALALAALGIALFGAAAWLEVYSGLPVVALFDSILVTRAVTLALGVLLLVAAFAPAGRGSGSDWLLILFWIGLGLGFLTTAMEELSVVTAIQRTGTTNPKIFGPSLAGGLVPLSLGLLVAAVAAWRIGTARQALPAAAS